MTESKKGFEVAHVFDAPVEKLWKYFTTPALMMKWWGPKDFTAPTIKIDFRVGGAFVYCMRGVAAPGTPPADFWNTGTYTEIVPMEKIATSMSFADKDGNVISALQLGLPGDWPMEVTVTVTFEKIEENKTKVTVQEVGIPTEMGENARLGWEQSFTKIAEVLM